MDTAILLLVIINIILLIIIISYGSTTQGFKNLVASYNFNSNNLSDKVLPYYSMCEERSSDEEYSSEEEHSSEEIISLVYHNN